MSDKTPEPPTAGQDGGLWTKGPALGGENIWQDGDQLLIAVDTNAGWEFAIVNISADEVAHMTEPGSGDAYTDWDFESISYWTHASRLPETFDAPSLAAQLAQAQQALEEVREFLSLIWGPDSLRSDRICATIAEMAADRTALKEQLAQAQGDINEAHNHLTDYGIPGSIHGDGLTLVGRLQLLARKGEAELTALKAKYEPSN